MGRHLPYGIIQCYLPPDTAGVEPATSLSQVRRPNHYTARATSSSCSSRLVVGLVVGLYLEQRALHLSEDSTEDRFGGQLCGQFLQPCSTQSQSTTVITRACSCPLRRLVRKLSLQLVEQRRDAATQLQKHDCTRKLCYRKDDRAMRPIHGCPENFRDSLTTPTASIPNIFSWAFVRIDPLNVPTKFEVCSFIRSSNNRGYPKNLDSPWIRPRSLFSKIVNRLLFRLTL